MCYLELECQSTVLLYIRVKGTLTFTSSYTSYKFNFDKHIDVSLCERDSFYSNKRPGLSSVGSVFTVIYQTEETAWEPRAVVAGIEPAISVLLEQRFRPIHQSHTLIRISFPSVCQFIQTL